MTIEMTEKQYNEVRTALIVAQIELQWSLEDAQRNKLVHMAALASERLAQIGEALEASNYKNVKVSY